MSRKKQEGFCNQPDREFPKMICGYPLPCPYHTIVIPEEKLEETVEELGRLISAEKKRANLDFKEDTFDDSEEM